MRCLVCMILVPFRSPLASHATSSLTQVAAAVGQRLPSHRPRVPFTYVRQARPLLMSLGLDATWVVVIGYSESEFNRAAMFREPHMPDW